MGPPPAPRETESVTSPHPLRRLLGPVSARDFCAEYLWLCLAGPLTAFSLFTFLAVLALGLWLTPVLLGFLVLAGAVFYARGLGAAHRRLARALLGVSVPAPGRPELKPGLWSWVKARVGDAAGWRAAGYLLLRLPSPSSACSPSRARPSTVSPPPPSPSSGSRSANTTCLPSASAPTTGPARSPGPRPASWCSSPSRGSRTPSSRSTGCWSSACSARGSCPHASATSKPAGPPRSRTPTCGCGASNATSTTVRRPSSSPSR
ncbi:sensor domain-containing protein [Amycolatopsis sp. Hca4]|uniref:sensor domain-containing protein n=1 Tax=Amycolatopsis sp. Hca4 TaxID=2742131 RepID=UPI0020CAEF33|nr:sensor domain-containing protein [Amycolatopsis sp. Hca4]